MLGADKRREVGRMRANELAEGEHHRSALDQGGVPPQREGGGRGAHSGIDLVLAREIDASAHLACRRVVNLAALTLSGPRRCSSGPRLPADPMSYVVHVASPASYSDFPAIPVS